MAPVLAVLGTLPERKVALYREDDAVRYRVTYRSDLNLPPELIEADEVAVEGDILARSHHAPR